MSISRLERIEQMPNFDKQGNGVVVLRRPSSGSEFAVRFRDFTLLDEYLVMLHRVSEKEGKPSVPIVAELSTQVIADEFANRVRLPASVWGQLADNKNLKK